MRARRSPETCMASQLALEGDKRERERERDRQREGAWSRSRLTGKLAVGSIFGVRHCQIYTCAVINSDVLVILIGCTHFMVTEYALRMHLLHDRQLQLASVADWVLLLAIDCLPRPIRRFAN